ncbi:MAG TPA: histidine kinase, partial [Cyanobacteria bacterium UBA12227]|nr:histidine kinase [Cyanobacteria bacterium UBA12227]
TRCHLDILEQFKIRAYALTPIFVGRNLWGLLAAYQHSGPRQWDAVEVEFLGQVASQLGVAIQSSELLSNTETRAEAMHQSAEQRQILFDVVAKIRESLDLETIFKTTAQEVRRSLKADRVGVFRFHGNTNFCSGVFIAEDVLSEFEPALGCKLEDHCFGEDYAPKYAQGRLQATSNIKKAGFQECYQKSLERFQIQAQIVVPLMEGDRLWGLLCVHQCSHPRNWEGAQLEFVTQVATQLSVALRQANLLSQTREQTEQLAQTLNDLQKAQFQIVQSEKMASLGQLVAGVAHEINNPVSFISCNISPAFEYAHNLLYLLRLYQQHYPDPVTEIAQQLEHLELEFIAEDFPKLLESMQEGANRIAEIVLSLRNFSRLDQSERKLADIHQGIDNTLLILQHRLKQHAKETEIQLIKNYSELPLIECYPGQLNQVFMNIISNAIDAIEESLLMGHLSLTKNTGKIQISTQVLKPNWIAIHISDNGSGLTPEMRSRIFDPFFTTKPPGKGTGLGLSISYRIIAERHGGHLLCHSVPNQGTEFVIELPIHQDQE